MTCTIMKVNGMTMLVHTRGAKPKSWKCECGRNRIKLDVVTCPACGAYRDGCPVCDSDVVFDKDIQPFTVGGAPILRVHACSCAACDFYVVLKH